MPMTESYHVPVLCREVVQYLLTDPGGTYVDGTVGGGGHAEAICRQLSGTGRLIGFDADVDAIRHATEHLERFADRVTLIHANVRALRAELSLRGIDRIRGLLLDLGVSSFQINQGSRGFSFRSDDALDMRMDQRQPRTAHDILNTLPESDLADIIYRYGEERMARRIARRIIAARPLKTTGDLADVVGSVVGSRFLSRSLARVFQALRIVVNDEMQSLTETLASVVDPLEPGGRVVAISYHSLEDRIVKEFFRAEAVDRVPSGHKLLPDTVKVPRMRILSKKPIVPAPDEIRQNPRARSAKMRVAERTAREM